MMILKGLGRMMKKGYIAAVAILVLMVASTAVGQSNVGRAGMTFLKLSPSARGVAMGDAYVGLSDDAGALFYNPAGMCLMARDGEAVVSWLFHPAGAYIGTSQLVVPSYVGGGKLGIGVTVFSTDDMEETTPEEVEGTGMNFRTTEWCAYTSYALDFTDKFAAGFTFKYIASFLAELSDASFDATTWAVDIGTIYKTDFRGLNLGMAITNFGSRPRYYSWETKLPMNFRVGISMDVIENLKGTVEFNHPNDNIETYHGGLEYSYLNLLALRGGFKYMEENYWWAGGFGVKLLNQKIKLDYAYQSFWLIPDFPFHYITLSYMF